MSAALYSVRNRLEEILRRHAKAEDYDLSDHDLVMRVMARYERARRDLLIDPNE